MVLLGPNTLLKARSWSLYFCLLEDWQLPMGFYAEGSAERAAAEPDVWTDGSVVEDKVSGASSSGSGFFTGRTGLLFATRWWESCRGFCFVPGPLQSVQRAEFWEVILVLQAADGVHFGFDNVGVVRHVLGSRERIFC